MSAIGSAPAANRKAGKKVAKKTTKKAAGKSVRKTAGKKSVKKAAAGKGVRKKSSRKTAPKTKGKAAVTAEERYRMIAECAYYKSQRSPEWGPEADARHWIAAEAEIDARIASLTGDEG